MNRFLYAIFAVILISGSAIAGPEKSDDQVNRDNEQKILTSITPDSGIYQSDYGQVITLRFNEKQTTYPFIYIKKAAEVDGNWGCNNLNYDNNFQNPKTGTKKLSEGTKRTEFMIRAIKPDHDISYGVGHSENEWAFFLPGQEDNESPDWGRYKMCIFSTYKATNKDWTEDTQTGTETKWGTDKKKKYFKIALGSFLAVAAEFMGIFYFLCWAWAAMPQAYLHYQQKSTSGFSWDYVAISTSTHLIYTLHHIIRHVWYKNQGLDQKSTLVDVLNTSWGLCWSTAKCIQCWYYPRSKGQGLTWASASTCGAIFGYAVIWLIMSAVGAVPFIEENGLWTFVDQLGMIKVAISFIKYMPQVYENWRRKSTGGFHPLNFLLDIGGVIGSFFQYFFLFWNEADPTYITGSIFSTVGLALVSLFFDAIFVYQHFILYRHKSEENNEENSKNKE